MQSRTAFRDVIPCSQVFTNILKESDSSIFRTENHARKKKRSVVEGREENDWD
jgi:hypothetical protein